MDAINELTTALGREPSRNEIAGHLADRISGLERNISIYNQEGDDELIAEAKAVIKDLRQETARLGFNREDYKGLYR